MEYGGLFPLLYIFAGTANVLLIKWSDNQQAECSDGKLRNFQHPVFQTFLMFLGQFLCFVIYKIIYFFLQRRGNGSENYNLLTRGNSDYSKLSMLLPAFLDAIASVMLFTGLYLTYASSFQLIRTGLLIFGGIFSAIYMDQRLIARHWMALFTIACGIVVILSIDVQRVSYDTASLPHTDVNALLTGNLLILCAQVFHGAQYVYEEKHMKMHDIPPMHAAGFQGIFGLVITSIMALCLNYIPGFAPINENSRAVIDDFSDVLTQLGHNKAIFGALIAFVFTSCCYNYIGLSITKASSMTNRVLTDCLRCLFVWLGVLLVEWEKMNLITIMGFIIVQMGIISYRNAIFIDWYRSFLARIQQRRYADLTPDAGEANVNSSSRPADVI